MAAPFARAAGSWATEAWFLVIGALSLALRTPAAETVAYPPPTFPDSSGWGRNIQRTMRLLAMSTAEKRNTVHILFYGQSIAEQQWAKLAEEDLRRGLVPPIQNAHEFLADSSVVALNPRETLQACCSSTSMMSGWRLRRASTAAALKANSIQDLISQGWILRKAQDKDPSLRKDFGQN